MSKVSASAKFTTRHAGFREILGSNPTAEVLCTSDGEPLFHEACIYHEPTRSVIVTSNQLSNASDDKYEATSHKHVKLFRIYDDGREPSKRCEEVIFSGVKYAMLNGGVNYGPDAMLLCAQGSKDSGDVSGIIQVSIVDPSAGVKVLVSDFHGSPFNSVNDVIEHPQDGSIWFTDPPYGYYQGICNKPVLPNQVYRFEPINKTIRAVADGFTRPNGLCFSPDLKTLYVTDTGAIHGSSDVPIDPAGPSHIYAFDVVSIHGAPALTNRRLFAYAAGRFPDGIKCDTEGNVYSGCGDGIEVWNPQGDLLGVIEIGGVANFCFGERGVIYACNEDKFWKIQLNQESVRGHLLGI